METVNCFTFKAPPPKCLHYRLGKVYYVVSGSYRTPVKQLCRQSWQAQSSWGQDTGLGSLHIHQICHFPTIFAPTTEVPSQLAQDFLFSDFFWLLSSGLKDGPPSDLASAVRVARLEEELDRLPLRLFSAVAPPCKRRPALRRRRDPVAFFKRSGLTRTP